MKDIFTADNIIIILLFVFGLSLYYSLYLKPRDMHLTNIQSCMGPDRTRATYDLCVQNLR